MSDETRRLEEAHKREWDRVVGRMMTASRLGPTSLLRLRAEYLLDFADKGKIAISEEERTTLERITVAPQLEDNEFLGGFDERLMADEGGGP